MLEELCRTAFFDRCMAVVKAENPLVRLKGTSPPIRHFDGFMSWNSNFHVWGGVPVKRVMHSERDEPLRLAWQYFNDHEEKICDAYFHNQYGGNVQQAMIESGTFEQLFDNFLTYFSDRRNQFMDETRNLLDAQKMNIVKNGKVPQSHGGVANLLKILTKTMQAQGTSIRTIAKVQYTICMQAGIYIPEEFITDVLVAANIEEGAVMHE